MRRRLESERGWAVVIAIVMMSIMLSVGLAAFAVVDTQHKESGKERKRESALNLDEAVLYAQGFVLAGTWPTKDFPYPATCNSGAVAALCPDPNTLAEANSGNPALANFVAVDYTDNVSWTTKVRDNGGSLASAYNPAQADQAQSGTVGTTAYTCPGPCTYDANGDKQMWVQARTVIDGHPRSVVARLQLERLTEGVPKQAVVAGRLVVSNNGNHGGTPLLQGNEGALAVRCDPPETCISAQPGQVSGALKTWIGSDGQMATPLMNADQLARLKAAAIADNNYYPGCPTKGGPNNRYGDNQYHLEGRVVWVDDCENPPQLANSTYTVSCPPDLPAGFSTKCINSRREPGILIWHKGRVELSGGMTFIGMVYAVNNSDNNPPSGDINGDVVTTNGGFGVWGAIAIDGTGGLNAGSNGLQLRYDLSAFTALQSYGTAGLVQNTWRELPPNQ
jgi:Tfp pilus assembly protein PilX